MNDRQASLRSTPEWAAGSGASRPSEPAANDLKAKGVSDNDRLL